MKTLIRFITRNAAGGAEYSDKVVDAPAITIGRATDQVLHIRDKRAKLQHATIEPANGGVRISSTALTGVIVNDRSQRAAKLATGDVIEIGSNIIKVIDAPDGVDFAISFELSENASTDHFVADWSKPVAGVGGWSKRRLSWTLVVAVAALGLLAPMFTWETFLQAGPIHSAHATTAAECDHCHVNAFERVPDTTCEACHTVDRHVVHSSAVVLGEVRCASCHLEHNEPEQLVNQHQGLCGDCHAGAFPDAALGSAGDFLDDHPDFSVEPQPGSTPDALIFNHAVHMDEGGIFTPDGRRVMECNECHVQEPGGAGFEPILMDEHCSDCHTLSFDPDDPSRTVPHGDPANVVQSLVEYYSARLLGEDPDAAEQRVRRPGQRLSRADRDRAAAEARVEALRVAEDLFERRACTNCHTVTAVDGDVPWHVEPVELTTQFFENAFFTHAAHQTGISDCTDCHAAMTSTLASDVLIPGIDNCRECHGSGFARRNAPGQTPSTCVMCHSFHFESRGPRE